MFIVPRVRPGFPHFFCNALTIFFVLYVVLQIKLGNGWLIFTEVMTLGLRKFSEFKVWNLSFYVRVIGTLFSLLAYHFNLAGTRLVPGNKTHLFILALEILCAQVASYNLKSIHIN